MGPTLSRFINKDPSLALQVPRAMIPSHCWEPQGASPFLPHLHE